MAATFGLVVGTPVMTDIDVESSSKVRRPISGAGSASGGDGSGVGAGSTNGLLFEPICSNVRKNSSDAGPLSSATTVPMSASVSSRPTSVPGPNAYESSLTPKPPRIWNRNDVTNRPRPR